MKSLDSAFRDDYHVEEREGSATEILSDYSKFVAVCIGYRCHPSELRLHLMKEISRLTTNLKRRVPKAAVYGDVTADPAEESSSKLRS